MIHHLKMFKDLQVAWTRDLMTCHISVLIATYIYIPPFVKFVIERLMNVLSRAFCNSGRTDFLKLVRS
jgi:hypothetical protein